MEEALIAYLLADSGVSALASTRLYWTIAPTGVAKPFATLLKVDGLRDTPMSGPTGFQQSRIQIDCYGTTFASAKGLARAVEAVLSGAYWSTATIEFQGCFLVAERDGFEDDASTEDLFRTSLDFITFHKGA